MKQLLQLAAPLTAAPTSFSRSIARNNPLLKATRLGCILIGASCCPVLQAQPTNLAFLTNGLSAYFPLSGNGEDASGNGRGLVASNLVFPILNTWPSSPVASFDGVSSYCYGGFSLLDKQTNWTWSAWLSVPKPGLTDRVLQRVYSEGNGVGNTFVIGVNPYDNHLVIDAMNTNWISFQPSIQLAGLGWSHLVITLQNGSVLRVYQDGKLRAGSPFPSIQSPLASTHLALGCSVYFLDAGRISEDTFNGLIDEVRVYNRTLSDDEVDGLFRYGRPESLAVAIKTVRVSMSVTIGKTYQLESSTNLVDWFAVGSAFTPTTWQTGQDVDVIQANQFFRFHVVP